LQRKLRSVPSAVMERHCSNPPIADAIRYSTAARRRKPATTRIARFRLRPKPSSERTLVSEPGDDHGEKLRLMALAAIPVAASSRPPVPLGRLARSARAIRRKKYAGGGGRSRQESAVNGSGRWADRQIGGWVESA
jgi:hypothetical protein